MPVVLHGLVQKIAALLVAPIVPICSMIGASSTVPATPIQTANMSVIMDNLIANMPIVEFSSPTFATTTAGLLPKVKVTVFHIKATSTIATSTTPKTQSALPKKPPAPKPAPISTTTSLKTASSTPLAISASALLNSMTISLKELLSNPFVASFNANLANGKNLAWDFGTATIGGASTPITQFAASYSCNPVPDQPPPETLDQRLLFEVKTKYDCTVSLTPQTGADRRTQSKNFLFMTPPGQLIVTPASVMNTVLTDDANNGGIVFTNQDSAPVTITGLTIDVSYQAFIMQSGPLVLRILDPATGQPVFDHHLENAQQISSSTFSYAEQGINAPVSFTIAAASKKMLPMQVLGVHKMSVQGIDPAIKISVRSVTTDRSDMKAVMESPAISWHCIVALGGFNPYATSDPFATGQACK